MLFSHRKEPLYDGGIFFLQVRKDSVSLAINCQWLAYRRIETEVFLQCSLFLEGIVVQEIDHLPTKVDMSSNICH